MNVNVFNDLNKESTLDKKLQNLFETIFIFCSFEANSCVVTAFIEVFL